jgi:hypothetical protein
MKKLFALFTVVLFSGFMMAQNNTSNVTETGDNNSAVVNQTGQNTSTITQLSKVGAASGTATDATVTQNGITNESIVYQDRTQSPDPRNEDVAIVSQTGESNYSYLEQAGIYGGSNLAKVTQISPLTTLGNDAYQYQAGYENNMEIYQNGAENYGYQLTGFTRRNTDYLQQLGTSNEAYQYAYGEDDQHITAYQNGTDNYSYQQQSGLKNVEYVNQTGNNNKAWQYQFHGSYMFNGSYASQHNASITQLGDGNNATQWQDENVAGAFDNSRNTSTIYQEGNANTSNVYQYDGLNIGNVTQVGNDNIGNIYQHTLSNTANINQSGVSNDAQVVQQ